MNHYSAFHTNGALAKVPVFAYLNAGLDADLRLDLMLLYTQALCNALASGKEYNEVQVQMIKTILRNKRFPAEMVRSVDQFMTQASLLSEDDLVCKTTRMLQGTAVGPLTLIHDMYRVASVNGFPESQVYAISLIAVGVGVDLDDLHRIESIVEGKSCPPSLGPHQGGGLAACPV